MWTGMLRNMHRQQAKQRTKQVIDAMVKYDAISQDEANRILDEGEGYSLSENIEEVA